MELRTDRYKLKDLFPDRAKKYAQKLHIKADEIEYVKKGIPIDPADISIDEGERAAIRLITTPRLDRDGEILLPDGAMLDDFRQSPSVLFGHKYDALPIGKDVWIKQSNRGILAKTVYANHQFAEDVFQCVRGGFLNSNSVGFIPIERVSSGDARFKDAVDKLEKDYGVSRAESNTARAIYTKWLLLEHSDVPVASNAQSLNLAVSKGELVLDSQRFKEELEITDPAPIAAPLPITDSAVQPKIDFCEACGTPTGVVEAEVPAVAPVVKMLDLDKNPSVNDIWNAVDNALNPSMMTEGPSSANPYKCLWDLYPAEYPSGNCVYNESQTDGPSLSFMVDYNYENGVVTLGETPVAVASGYVRRGRKGMGGQDGNPLLDGYILEMNTVRADIANILNEIQVIKATPAPLAEVPASAPPPIDDLDIEPDEDVLDIEPDEDVLTLEPSVPAPAPVPAPKTLTPDEVEGAIIAGIAKLDIRAEIEKSVSLTLDRLRGRVR